MGQAKRRGPIEQRIAEGVASAEARERERTLAQQRQEEEARAAWDALPEAEKRRKLAVRRRLAEAATLGVMAGASLRGGRF